MPILAEPRFLTVDDGYLLEAGVEMTCQALRVERGDPLRKEITIRAADLARSGLKSPEAIRDRIVHEATALSDIAA